MIATAWMVLYFAWIASEFLTIALTYTRRGGGEVQDRGSMRLLWLVICTSMFVGSWIGAVKPHTIFGGAAWVRTAALAMIAVGLAIRWSSIITLGRAFSVNVAIREGQRVMRSGLYGVVRHPSYTGLLLAIYAVGLHTRNWLALAIIAVPPTAALLYRIRIEEEALTRAFGQEYVEYSAETKRLLPGIY